MRMCTYDDSRKCASKDDAVCAKYPNIVAAFDDPWGDGDAHGNLLTAIRVTVQLPVFADGLIRQSSSIESAREILKRVMEYIRLVCLCDLDELCLYGIHGLVHGEFDLVRVAVGLSSVMCLRKGRLPNSQFTRELLVMRLDFLYGGALQ